MKPKFERKYNRFNKNTENLEKNLIVESPLNIDNSKLEEKIVIIEDKVDLLLDDKGSSSPKEKIKKIAVSKVDNKDAHLGSHEITVRIEWKLLGKIKTSLTSRRKGDDFKFVNFSSFLRSALIDYQNQPFKLTYQSEVNPVRKKFNVRVDSEVNSIYKSFERGARIEKLERILGTYLELPSDSMISS